MKDQFSWSKEWIELGLKLEYLYQVDFLSWNTSTERLYVEASVP